MAEGINRERDKDIKVEIPDFQGSLNPDDLLDWLRSVEKNLLSIKDTLIGRLLRFLEGLDEKIASRVRMQQKTIIPLKKYFQCQGYGHFAKECPSKRALSTLEVVHWGEDEVLVCDNEEEPDSEAVREVEETEIMVMHDLGLNLVTWIVMHAQPLEMDQRQQIFSTMCTIKERVFNLIFDGGSCTNVDTKALIEKLRDCVHQRRENTYSFKLGKKKITLTPLPPALKYTAPPSLVEYSKEMLMIGEIEMVQDLNSREIILILLAKRITEEALLPLPAKIQQTLRTYGDVFPKELPSGLPPLRGIEHYIDLIPGAVLPNKAVYRNDPKATHELQKQVGELMSRRFVRESLSPCAVPALLVSKRDRTWKMCTGSRAINNITIKYRFPIPRLDDILDELSEANIFSKIDLRQDFNKLFEVNCDASGVGICAVLMRGHKPVAILQLCTPKGAYRGFLIKEAHSNGLAGHFGVQKTDEIFQHQFYWPKMLGYVQDVIIRCAPCQQSKSYFQTGPYTLLLVPHRFSKMAHFVTCTKTEKTVGVADLYFKEIVKLHGRTLWKLLKTKLLFSTSHHPKTDRQIEATNKTLGRILRCTMAKSLRDSYLKLAAAKFAFNRGPSNSTGQSPFEVVYGENPLMPTDLAPVRRD
ncbi:uncharacterized protein LOC141620060 [Silene latifolia]|uniref:uncharacterized protein LOC141620060 n=1 Tax=Silene latifolia TaxID=37657 RepID=UPI003D7896B8